MRNGFLYLLVTAALLVSKASYAEEQGGGVHVFGDALYWYTTETIDWASTPIKTGNVEITTFKTLNFDWSPGFRAGIGYTEQCDQWETQLYYTYFRTHANDKIREGSEVIQSEFLGAKLSFIGDFLTAKIDLKLDYNMFDWELGRNFCICDTLILRPLIGVKGGWIDQRIKTKWGKEIFFFEEFPVSATDNLKNNFWGVGPKGGVNGKWILGSHCNCSFSLIGDFSGAFMWGHWTIQDRFEDSFQTTVIIKVRDRNFGAFMLQGLVGVRFDYNFDSCLSCFSIKVGYEIEDWFNQYQVFDNGTGTHTNDLLLQGLTVEVRLDF